MSEMRQAGTDVREARTRGIFPSCQFPYIWIQTESLESVCRIVSDGVRRVDEEAVNKRRAENFAECKDVANQFVAVANKLKWLLATEQKDNPGHTDIVARVIEELEKQGTIKLPTRQDREFQKLLGQPNPPQ
jgi:hypothetical protein